METCVKCNKEVKIFGYRKSKKHGGNICRSCDSEETKNMSQEEIDRKAGKVGATVGVIAVISGVIAVYFFLWGL